MTTPRESRRVDSIRCYDEHSAKRMLAFAERLGCRLCMKPCESFVAVPNELGFNVLPGYCEQHGAAMLRPFEGSVVMHDDESAPLTFPRADVIRLVEGERNFILRHVRGLEASEQQIGGLLVLANLLPRLLQWDEPDEAEMRARRMAPARDGESAGQAVLDAADRHRAAYEREQLVRGELEVLRKVAEAADEQSWVKGSTMKLWGALEDWRAFKKKERQPCASSSARTTATPTSQAGSNPTTSPGSSSSGTTEGTSTSASEIQSPAAARNARLARYLVTFLKRRNDGALQRVLEGDDLLADELEWILAAGGHPPNWEPLETPSPAAVADDGCPAECQRDELRAKHAKELDALKGALWDFVTPETPCEYGATCEDCRVCRARALLRRRSAGASR